MTINQQQDMLGSHIRSGAFFPSATLSSFYILIVLGPVGLSSCVGNKKQKEEQKIFSRHLPLALRAVNANLNIPLHPKHHLQTSRPW
jgi:hypothetical protein